jgi:hypothetical protein
MTSRNRRYSSRPMGPHRGKGGDVCEHALAEKDGCRIGVMEMENPNHVLRLGRCDIYPPASSDGRVLDMPGQPGTEWHSPTGKSESGEANEHDRD